MWGFIISLVVGGIIGWVADMLTSTNVPGGVIGYIILGFVGSWVGGLLLGDLGPMIQDFAIIPAILGAALVVFLFGLIAGNTGRR